jgi:membrane-associated phospholipid phosphatase
MRSFAFALCALSLHGALLRAQDSTQHQPPSAAPKPAWITRSDFAHAGVAAVGLGALSLADESVAKLFQRQALQNSTVLHHSANIIQTAGDPGALVASLSFYAIGAISHKPGLADAGLHSTEAIAVSGAITNILKLAIGRARPNLSSDSNAFQFHLAHGNVTDHNSFPSGHTTAAFAAAAVFNAEIKRLHPGAGRASTIALYGLASLVGASRMYNNRHWLTDVVGGAMIGTFVGDRLTAHVHPTP